MNKKLEDYRVGVVFNRGGPSEPQLSALLRELEERMKILGVFELCIPLREQDTGRPRSHVPKRLLTLADKQGMKLRLQCYSARGEPSAEMLRWLEGCDETYCLPAQGRTASNPDWCFSAFLMLRQTACRPKLVLPWGGINYN